MRFHTHLNLSSSFDVPNHILEYFKAISKLLNIVIGSVHRNNYLNSPLNSHSLF